MGEQEDPLVSVHYVLGFLPDFDSLSDQPMSLFQKDRAGNLKILNSVTIHVWHKLVTAYLSCAKILNDADGLSKLEKQRQLIVYIHTFSKHWQNVGRPPRPSKATFIEQWVKFNRILFPAWQQIVHSKTQ